jgi:hypothetical protein
LDTECLRYGGDRRLPNLIYPLIICVAPRKGVAAGGTTCSVAEGARGIFQCLTKNQNVWRSFPDSSFIINTFHPHIYITLNTSLCPSQKPLYCRAGEAIILLDV